MTVPQDCQGKYGISKADIERILSENRTSEFYKLEGVPGYRLTTLSWEEASNLAKTATFESLGALGRHPSDIVVYRRFKAKV